MGEKSCFYQSIAILTCICLRRTVALFTADSPSFQSDFPLHKTCCSAWACSEKPSDLWCLSAKIDLITTTKKKQLGQLPEYFVCLRSPLWPYLQKVLDHYCPIKPITGCWCLAVLVSVRNSSYYSYTYDPPQRRGVRNHCSPFQSSNSMLFWSREALIWRWFSDRAHL